MQPPTSSPSTAAPTPTSPQSGESASSWPTAASSAMTSPTNDTTGPGAGRSGCGATIFVVALLAFSGAHAESTDYDRLYHLVADAKLSGKAQTVTGPVDPATLGFTLMHEHLFTDFFPDFP